MDAKKKAKLGQRFVCFSCAAKFYDLNKPEPLCPRCGADPRASPLLAKAAPKRRSRKAASGTKKGTKKKARARRSPLLSEGDEQRSREREAETTLGGDAELPEIDVEDGEAVGEVQVEES